MSLVRIQKTSLVQNIVDQIEEAIINGTYKSGDKLPTSQKLQQIIGASHGTVREALRILEQKGLIEIRQGIKGGSFVRESSTEPITEGLGLLIRQCSISYPEIAAFRKVVEIGMIDLVIENITPEDVDVLKKKLVLMQNAILKGQNAWKDVLDIEIEIRQYLINITNNKMYDIVLMPIFINIVAYAHQIFSTEELPPGDAYDDWVKIINAIEAKDIKKASQIILRHIDRYVDLNSGKIS